MMANVKATLLAAATGQSILVRRTDEIEALRLQYAVSDISMIKELRSQAQTKVSLWNSAIEDTLADVHRSYYNNVGRYRVEHVCDRLGVDSDNGLADAFFIVSPSVHPSLTNMERCCDEAREKATKIA